MDYLRFNVTTHQVDASLIISVPLDGVGSGPLVDNPAYMAADAGWVWRNTDDTDVQSAINAATEEATSGD